MQVPELWSQEDRLALATFEVALKNDDLAGALLAVEGVTPKDAAECRILLHEYGQRTQDMGLDPVSAMGRVLVDQEGFHGDTDDYYNPSNSYLSSVVDRKRGLPILLSALWMLVGEQAGISVEGIGLPGHFIVRVGGAGGVLVDPFAGGKMLSVSDCARMVDVLSSGTVTWDDAYLTSISLDALLERVLRNLMHSFQRAGEPESLFRAAKFYSALRPHEVEPLLVHARLAEAMGARQMAVDIYGSIQDHFPNTPAAELAGSRLVDLRGEPFETN
jgi:regulator of sirC expression with transglutaminase-like and TPR domain